MTAFEISGEKVYTDPGRRHEFVLLFDVRDGNPNGDPDAGNMPRIDPETMQGLTTDVMLKRRIRDYVAIVYGKPIFIQSQAALNTLILNAFREIGVDAAEVDLTNEEQETDELLSWLSSKQEAGFSLTDGKLLYLGEAQKERELAKLLTEGLEGDQKELSEKLMDIARRLAAALKTKNVKITRENQEKARGRLCAQYFDIRLFGAVLSTGLNAGQVRGPVQFTFARSIDPILPLDLAITRQARTTIERMATGTTEMGRKPIVPYGLYRAHGFYNPYLAKTTGVTEEDLVILYEALSHLFDFDRSAARGQMNVRGLAVFSHNSAKGNAPVQKLFHLIKVCRREEVKVPRSFEDYRVLAPRSGSLAAYCYPDVTLTWLVEPENLEELCKEDKEQKP